MCFFLVFSALFSRIPFSNFFSVFCGFRFVLRTRRSPLCPRVSCVPRPASCVLLSWVACLLCVPRCLCIILLSHPHRARPASSLFTPCLVTHFSISLFLHFLHSPFHSPFSPFLRLCFSLLGDAIDGLFTLRRLQLPGHLSIID